MENQFELLAEFQYSSEAAIYKGKLESEGIAVFVRDQFTVEANPIWSNAVGGVKLYVKAEDIERAKAVMNAISPFSVDDTGQLLTCPNCGAEKLEMLTTIKNRKALGPFVISLLIGGYPYHVEYVYKCRDCQFEFNKQV